MRSNVNMKNMIVSCILICSAPYAVSDSGRIKKSDYSAIETFVNCVQNSKDYIPTKDSLFCGVLAQSKPQIVDYLICPTSKKFRPDRVEQFGNVDEKILSYKCSKFRWIQIVVTKKKREVVVTSIGEAVVD